MKLSLVFCIALLVSCNDKEKSSTENAEPTPVEVKETIKQLIVELDLKTSKPDNFKLFSNDVFLNNNQFMNIGITHKLNINEFEKKIKFEFPENIAPDVQLILSLGTKSVKDVEIKNATISFGNTKFIIGPGQLNEFFTTNKFIDYDTEKNILSTKKIDGKHNPLIFVRRKILDSIQNI